MYIGGGTLGTILVALLVLWLLGNVRSPRREQIIHKLWGTWGGTVTNQRRPRPPIQYRRPASRPFDF
jgi:hypothetical protein